MFQLYLLKFLFDNSHVRSLKFRLRQLVGIKSKNRRIIASTASVRTIQFPLLSIAKQLTKRISSAFTLKHVSKFQFLRTSSLLVYERTIMMEIRFVVLLFFLVPPDDLQCKAVVRIIKETFFFIGYTCCKKMKEN